MNYRIEKDGLAVCIDDAGAQLTSVCWQDREYLWQGDPAYWSDQSLLLFPYVGRFTEGKTPPLERSLLTSTKTQQSQMLV